MDLKTSVLVGCGVFFLSIVGLGGYAIKYLINDLSNTREQLGVQKAMASFKDSQIITLNESLRDTLMEVQEAQKMQKALEEAGQNDKSEIGPTGRALLDSLQRNEPPVGTNRGKNK